MRGFSVPCGPPAQCTHCVLAAAQNLPLINLGGGEGGWAGGQQFGRMFAGLSEPLPICVVFISSRISARGRGLRRRWLWGRGWVRTGRAVLLEMLSAFLRASARRRTDVGTCGDRPHMLRPIHRHSDTATMARLCARRATKYINLRSPEHRSG